MDPEVQTILDICRELNADQIRELSIELHELFQDKAHAKVRMLRPGTKVKFRHSNGFTIEGTLLKVNYKTVKIAGNKDRHGRPANVNWSVSPNLVEVA